MAKQLYPSGPRSGKAMLGLECRPIEVCNKCKAVPDSRSCPVFCSALHTCCEIGYYLYDMTLFVAGTGSRCVLCIHDITTQWVAYRSQKDQTMTICTTCYAHYYWRCYQRATLINVHRPFQLYNPGEMHSYAKCLVCIALLPAQTRFLRIMLRLLVVRGCISMCRRACVFVCFLTVPPTAAYRQ